ncbi:penicillin-binding protein 2 [Pseudalkalibacillus hwajinpoensis]|uniref:peptidoglycan D,D-transpeptidase FtsI family protein n=1 Tax=Guptibacillus hwajinpoensis TaxID=208199 RepID=UPI00325A4D41
MKKSKNTKGSHKKVTAFRLNMMFFCVFFLFSILILRIGSIQIVNGEEYENKATETEVKVTESTVPRGKMYDRNENLIVGNQPQYALTYTRDNSIAQNELLETAKELANYIEVDVEDLTKEELKKYWLQTNTKEANALITADEKERLSEEEIQSLKLKRLTDEQLNQLSSKEKEIVAIKNQMLSGYFYSSVVIKKDLTNDEIARVSEHLGSLPGIHVKVLAERTYPYEDTFRDILGNTGPIAKEKLSEYESMGYEATDKVGTSFLEEEYEPWLKGIKSKKIFSTDDASSPELIPGERGNDLVLSIDIALQEKANEILKRQLQNSDIGATSAYAVMMDPNTGEILAMAGQKQQDGNYINQAYGNVYNAYEMGSAVKGASVLTGMNEDVIQPGSRFYDEPVLIPATPEKSSYVNMGLIDDLEALERSSNVYMFKTAMELAGYEYEPNKAGIPWDREAYDTIRKNFEQFGLGVKTGIDLPSESNGYNGGVKRLGNLMDLMIGQFDTYTPLQMVQYISTIANDGKRLEPHLLKRVHESTKKDKLSSSVLYQNVPTVLNRLSVTEGEIERVQRGLYLVMNGDQGTATDYFEDTSYVPAGKTGTAEVGDGQYNLSLVGYAPYNNPEVAFAVIVPGVEKEGSINKHIGRDLLDAYFQMKEEK